MDQSNDTIDGKKIKVDGKIYEIFTIEQILEDMGYDIIEDSDGKKCAKLNYEKNEAKDNAKMLFYRINELILTTKPAKPREGTDNVGGIAEIMDDKFLRWDFSEDDNGLGYFKDYSCVVAYDEGDRDNWQGFVTYLPHEIDTMVVANEAQKSGIGANLMKLALKEIYEKYGESEVRTEPISDAGEALDKKVGFEERDNNKRYFFISPEKMKAVALEITEKIEELSEGADKQVESIIPKGMMK